MPVNASNDILDTLAPSFNLLNVNDIIIEVQKQPVQKSKNLAKIIEGIVKKGEKTLLLTVINSNNQRRS